MVSSSCRRSHRQSVASRRLRNELQRSWVGADFRSAAELTRDLRRCRQRPRHVTTPNPSVIDPLRSKFRVAPMKLLVDVAKLVAEGAITSQQAKQISRAAAGDTGTLAINRDSHRWAFAVVAGRSACTLAVGLGSGGLGQRRDACSAGFGRPQIPNQGGGLPCYQHHQHHRIGLRWVVPGSSRFPAR
jgi:hypothetical protein